MNTGVISAAGNLDADLEGTAAVIAAEERQARDNSRLHQEAKSRGRLVKLTVLVALVLIGLTLVLLRHNSLSHQSCDQGFSLPTASGFMTGRYQMISESGERFEIDVPTFSLDSPDNKRVLN